MQQITLRLPESLLDELDEEAEERGISRSEHVRNVLESRRHTDDLRERLERREDRIDELEEQLARRSQVEEKIDTLAKRSEEPAPPFFVRWARWFRSRGESEV